MKQCIVDKIKVDEKILYCIRSADDLAIIKEPSKYLKHKMMTHCSPNTVRKIAYALCYYIAFIQEKKLTVEQVLSMKYGKQHEHFVKYLIWLKAGNHCEREKIPSNNTCNSYLQCVFGFYEFVTLEYEKDGEIRVLEERHISYSNSVGVRFKRSVNSFRGYLPAEQSVGKTIAEERIKKLLDASNSMRNRLLILMLAETGFRIGELLGIRYAKDIDYDHQRVAVAYRENNENEARAKRAEERWAQLSPNTFELLLLYISENRELLSKTEYLFVNLHGEHKGKPMTVNGVYSALNVLDNKTDIKATPHMLRHYFANERRKAGWKTDRISAALGHKQIATTERYMNIEEEELAEAMEQYFAENEGLFDISKLL